MLCYSKRCKLNVDDVKKIKILIEKKMNLKDIAKMFSVSPASISGIKNGKRWSHV
jgi:DNA-binding Xre family transcriptional regulator